MSASSAFNRYWTDGSFMSHLLLLQLLIEQPSLNMAETVMTHRSRNVKRPPFTIVFWKMNNFLLHCKSCD